MSKTQKYKTIDLFAGAGGLSLGFMQTKKFDIKVAFENNPNMQRTYMQNHKKTTVYGDVCTANYGKIQEDFGEFDVVIGGPPCQGFSNANRQKNYAISMNNMLVKEYMRAVIELQPKAFVMENVSMLKSDVHRFYMERSDVEKIKKYNIPYKITTLELLPKKYKFNNAINIVQNIDSINLHMWDESLYSIINNVYKNIDNKDKVTQRLKNNKDKYIKVIEKQKFENNDYVSNLSRNAINAVCDYYLNKDLKALKEAIEPAVFIQRMLGKAKEIFDNDIVVEEYNADNGIVAKIKSFAVYDYIKAILGSDENNYTIKSDVLCATEFGAPQKRKRFIIIGVKKDISDDFEMPKGEFTEPLFRTVRDAIEDIQDVDTVFSVDEDKGVHLEKKENLNSLAKDLRNSEFLYNHIITNTTDVALERFKALGQGQNFHTLDESMKTTYTDPSRTQNTVYLRLKYDEPSGTVINVRKSMWVHPVLDRALSIREAARLQTFPDSFRFCGSKDKQYQQVGNAVPPILSKSIAKCLINILKKQ